MNFATLRSYLLHKPGASEDFPFDTLTLVIKVGGKMFACIGAHTPGIAEKPSEWWLE